MFRCHIHQMLCIGGSQFPFGWSFVSIAKVPMTWNPTDVWTAEVELPAGMRLEYKYVILEEQDWTKQEDEDAEGVMEWTYRTGTEPGRPPDVQTIRKQMAIVDWQPGPNRVVDVPTVEELSKLKPGEAVARTPAQPRPLVSSSSIRRRSSTLALFPPQRMWEFEQLGMEQSEPSQVVWEELSIDEDGRPLLKRNDVWPYYIHKADTSSDQYPD
ncbi:unnamed protein product [Ostreobium quekettii]|uniref:CBM20 domain-containing protein n=1 Tax=Ostreobium quekettii TaxID=121088 RepID=A0A8S1J8Z7_9CHLO|nr:unnamed protein product [Ostreobium quekettii]|eukprot:evm.model.scf_3690.1 EVM.evm.TU.scf_3690.1   scf_3690:6597-8496(-)